MSAIIVPHTSTTPSAASQQPMERQLVPTEQGQVGQQVVSVVTELVTLATVPHQQPFLTSDAEGDIEPAPTAHLSTRLELYLSLDLPSTVSPPVYTPSQISPACTATEQGPVAPQRSCTPTEIAPASCREHSIPPPTPPRPRLRHQDPPIGVLGPSNIPRVARTFAYTKSPGYVVPYKRYRDWATGSTYTLLEPIAAGGFGCALKVKVKNHCIALKVCADNDDKRPSYNREVNVLMMLKEHRHPNIVKFGSAFKDRGQLCLSLELANKSLENAIRTVHQMDTGLVKHLASGIARGLDHLHKNHILHRDIKPENILLTGDASSHPVITDFGLAINLKGKPLGTRGECGTKQYRAPEMLGRNYYSFPVDVFAFGVTIHRMAGGQFPEQGGIIPLSNVEVKDMVTQLMHALAGVRPKMDEALKDSFFQELELDESEASGNKRPLEGATEDDRKGKRARRDSKEEDNNNNHYHVQERISFSLRPAACGLSLQDVKEVTTIVVESNGPVSTL
ncbi:MAG: kinase-like domain-containing protein [Linnemannia gamsii]|nr:MAG: kinase-like domain-containing protein [Linnemannia gamsii]